MTNEITAVILLLCYVGSKLAALVISYIINCKLPFGYVHHHSGIA
jgi:hypothetical protein